MSKTWPQWLTLLASTLTLALLPWASPAQAAPVTVKDDRGQTVSLPDVPRRIISLLPSLTETVCALDECGRLIGTDRWSDHPAEVQKLPKLGGLDDTPVEAIVALKPDVVLLALSSRLADRLEALGVKVVALEPKTHVDVQRVMGTIAQLLGKPQAAAVAWARIDRAIHEAAATVPAAIKGSTVYYEVSPSPHAAGEASFIGETLSRLGVRNIVPRDLGPFPQLNPEFIVRANPQIIMVGQRNAATVPTRPGWAGVRAIKDQKVCIWIPAESDVLARPGPRMDESARIMARCLRQAAQGPVPPPSTPFNAKAGGMR